MLSAGRIPMSKKEASSVDELLAELGDESPTLTRRDPKEKGPILVHAGSRTFEVDGSKVKEL
jgi:hypothetical protein